MIDDAAASDGYSLGMAPIHAQQSIKIAEGLTLIRTKDGELFVAHHLLREPVPVPLSSIESLLMKAIREAVAL